MDKYNQEIHKKRVNQLMWSGFGSLIVLSYFLLSSGDFSFVLTFSAGVQCFGFGLVIFTVHKTGDISGISWNSFCLSGLALLGRLMSILLFEGYLPVDASGDHIYKVFEILSLIFCLMILKRMRTSLTRSSQEPLEIIKWYFLAPPMLLLAYFIHPGLNYFAPLDIIWTFGLYLESVALLPQVLLFMKRGEIEDHTSNFIVSQCLSKILSFIFWFASFHELNAAIHESSISVAPHLSGYFVLGSQLFQIFLMGDFLYLYFKSWKTGIPINSLPMTSIV